MKLVECMEDDGPWHHQINLKSVITQRMRPNNYYNKGR